jgi:hypothetical protein
MVLGGHRARSAKRARSLLRSEPQERKTWSRMFCRFEAKGVPTAPESEYDGQPLRLLLPSVKPRRQVRVWGVRFAGRGHEGPWITFTYLAF